MADLNLNEPTPRDELVTLLTSPQHAPMSDHAPDWSGNPECVSCPWPLHMLPPEEIADVLIAAGWTKGQP